MQQNAKKITKAHFGSELNCAFGRAYARLYGSPPQSAPSKRRFRFCRERLPPPSDYYRERLHVLHIRGIWASANCPFHRDRRPSLNVNLVRGNFKCFGCGAKGGDVLDFHRRFHDMGFVEAAKDLGVWEMDR